MNINRLIHMGLRLLMRKGTQLAASRGKRPEDMNSEERAQTKAAQQTRRKAQKGMRAVRRFIR